MFGLEKSIKELTDRAIIAEDRLNVCLMIETDLHHQEEVARLQNQSDDKIRNISAKLEASAKEIVVISKNDGHLIF